MHFPFQLDEFQTQAIAAIDRNENVVARAHTGCGKTVIAEYGIFKAREKKRRVIYTSPLKSLTNQKYLQFRQKFPNERIGLLTGDKKIDPDAAIILQTAEILRNSIACGESMDDLECVIMDEAHFFNDPERGKVWEETIVELPKHVMIILLSATVAKPQVFANHVQVIRQRKTTLVSTEKRHVPLKYMVVSDMRGHDELRGSPLNNEAPLHIVYNGEFQEQNYSEYLRTYKQQLSKNLITSKSHRLNHLVSCLGIECMVPCIVFCFSRAKCQEYASQIHEVLIDHKERSNLERLARHYLHKWWHTLTTLETFNQLYQLMLKGVAYHHSGMLPIVKEFIEIAFEKNLIKVLFATETLAVGVNMPTRTVVFTQFTKPTHRQANRPLRADEFLQMAGRAGRRGLDVIGNVILFPLEEPPTALTLKNLIESGMPQMKTQFYLDDNTIFCKSPELLDRMFQQLEITPAVQRLNEELEEAKQHLEMYRGEHKDALESPCLEEYLQLTQKMSMARANQQKKIRNKLFKFKDNPNIHKYNNMQEYVNKVNTIQQEITALGSHLRIQWDLKHQFHLYFEFTGKRAQAARQIMEGNAMIIGGMLADRRLDNLTQSELLGWLAIFTENATIHRNDLRGRAIPLLIETNERFTTFQDYQERHNIDITPTWRDDYICYPMYDVVKRWAEGTEFREIASDIKYTGNFCKSMLRLINLVEQFKRAAQEIQAFRCINTLDNYEEAIMRDFICNDSLYFV
uniref:DEAD/DEAH box helicase n=1 Tax=Megaviridae environmental sample TaxID=1737588 RepID=A0A5J6VJE8_9VIRU|nr:MAG: DEAD/DEAH box helicase [Megaviridae environmental sample]